VTVTRDHRAAPSAALWASRWPAEDGGPRRTQAAQTGGLAVAARERLRVAARRDVLAATMVVHREPGEVFLLRHSLGYRRLAARTEAWVERIDPQTLCPLQRSQPLPGGRFWPGGLAAHQDGALIVVHGRHCHRLSANLDVLASRRLPQPRPYNSFVVLADGAVVMKDLDLRLREPARLAVLDPSSLEPLCPETTLPESCVARLSADGNTVYAVGATTIWRYHWDGSSLRRDDSWCARYHGGDGHSYGWDPVLAGGHAWFLDNGAHDYTVSMHGAGRASGSVRLIRVSCDDAEDIETVDVCGAPRGSVSDPPLYDETRKIAVGYDSANGVVRAFRFGGRLEPLWQRSLAHAAHMLQFPDTGELVLGDFHAPPFASSAISRAIAARFTAPARSRRVRAGLARMAHDDVVVVDIETGEERARASVPSMFQSVLFPAPGLDRDLYWCTFSTLARLEVV
jgi:hypothetical protein